MFGRNLYSNVILTVLCHVKIATEHLRPAILLPMHITKYRHACIVLENHGQKIIIDPGDQTPTFGSLENVAAVIVTHIHPDHFYPPHLMEIIDRNPSVRIFTTQETSHKLDHPAVTAVKDGDEHTVGLFTFHFTGELHEGVHPDWPTTVQNIGVRVNDMFYYGGDSLTLPDKPIKVLAVPVSYGWVRMDEALDYIASVKPDICFPTHNGQLSEAGNIIAGRWVTRMCDKHGIGFRALEPGDSFEV